MHLWESVKINLLPTRPHKLLLNFAEDGKRIVYTQSRYGSNPPFLVLLGYYKDRAWLVESGEVQRADKIFSIFRER